MRLAAILDRPARVLEASTESPVCLQLRLYRRRSRTRLPRALRRVLFCFLRLRFCAFRFRRPLATLAAVRTIPLTSFRPRSSQRWVFDFVSTPFFCCAFFNDPHRPVVGESAGRVRWPSNGRRVNTWWSLSFLFASRRFGCRERSSPALTAPSAP